MSLQSSLQKLLKGRQIKTSVIEVIFQVIRSRAQVLVKETFERNHKDERWSSASVSVCLFKMSK